MLSVSPFSIQGHSDQTSIRKDTPICYSKYTENRTHVTFRSMIVKWEEARLPSDNYMKETISEREKQGQTRPTSNRTRKRSQETNIFQEFTENVCH